MRKSNRKGLTTIEGMVSGAIVLIMAGVGFGAYFAFSGINKYFSSPMIERTNVIGNEKDDLFIDKNGKRFYAEIDGKSIDTIFDEYNKD